MASDEEFSAGISTTASPSVKQVKTEFATPADISTATSGLASQEWVNQQILSANPTGTIIIWSTATAPSGYFICDGSAISRTTYSNLFSVIGTTYGDGDGSTTFNVPTQIGGMPDYSKTTAMPSTGFTATKDGWCSMRANVNANYIDITINGSYVYSISNNNYAVGSVGVFPVNKGDVITVAGTSYSIKELYFAPCKINSCIKY